MPQFSKKSLQKLATCDPRLQMICHEAIKTIDFTVIYGHRGKEEQDAAYKAKRTQLRWPNSKHNSMPSMAVDIAPVKYAGKRVWIDWADTGMFLTLVNLVKEIARERKIEIVCGADWKSLRDYPHIELVEKQQNSDNIT